MARIVRSIEVDVLVRTAYTPRTRFEEFPKFMEGVRPVRRLNGDTLRWITEINGHREEWEAKITEQIPDMGIAWRNTTGSRKAGLVIFAPIDDASTHISLRVDDERSVTGLETNALARRVEADLARFKEFVQTRQDSPGPYGAVAPTPRCSRGQQRSSPVRCEP